MLVTEECSLYIKSSESQKWIGATIYIKDSHGDWIVRSFKLFPAIFFCGFCASVSPLELLGFLARIKFICLFV